MSLLQIPSIMYKDYDIDKHLNNNQLMISKIQEETLKKLINIALILILIAIYIFYKNVDFGEVRWDNKNVHYVKAKVLEVLEEDLSKKYNYLNVGSQKLRVKILEGKEAGKEKIIDNTLFNTSSILAKSGTRIILLIDSPEGVEPYYTVYNYDRSIVIAIYIALFILLLYAVGKKNGLKSALALIISIYIIALYMLPSIYIGRPIILVTLVTILLASIYSAVIIFGYSLIGLVNIISILISFIIVAVLSYLVSLTSHLSGFVDPNAEGLFYIVEKTGMQLQYLFFAGIAISTYGAAKDVSVSISSALLEIKTLNKNMGSKDLFKSGMNIGKDIIATMVDTLIFAFIGSSLTTVLSLMSYGVQFNQLIISNFFSMELANGLIATSVVVMMVPISAYISSLVYNIEDKSMIRKFLTK